MTLRRKLPIIIGSIIGGLGFLFICLLVFIGWYNGSGPFDGLYVSRLVRRYADEARGGIVFYGASNFTLWAEMNEDLSPYNVINCGFGGSDDTRLVKYAEKLVYPLAPSIVFFQTGSNDYMNLKGTDDEIALICMEYKKNMFAMFHEHLPGAKLVIMGGLLLPGRSEYVNLTKKINEELKNYCSLVDYMYFIDADDMTWDGTGFFDNLFRKDGIHLNRDGQQLWAKRILPVLNQIAN